jgi:hypothetical protein
LRVVDEGNAGERLVSRILNLVLRLHADCCLRNLASIGAIVVILCLPLDLFFQQIIAYEQVFIVMPRNASLPRTTTYEASGALMVNGMEFFSQDDTMSSILSPFFYSDGVMPALRSYCPTSNCTWEPFETLSVCSSCTPLEDEFLHFDCITGPADWPSNALNFTGGPEAFPNVTQCGWFLNASDPATRVLMNGYIFDPQTNERGETLETRLFSLVDVFTLAPYYGGSVHYKDRFADSILDAFIVAAPGGADAIRADRRPTAMECALTWCIQTLQSSASWGNMTENITAQHFRDTKDFAYPYFTDGNDFQYLNSINFTPPSQHPVTLEDYSTALEPKSFGLSNSTAWQIIMSGEIVVPAFYTRKGEDITYKNKIWAGPAGVPSRNMSENPWLGELDVASRFVQIAKAMTNMIRNQPSVDGSQEIILGTSWDERTHVVIRWVWICLPLFLLALSLILLIGTVMKSTKEESVVGIWKTSVIAILFNGVDDQVQNSVSSNCRMTEARMKARQLYVKLVPE